MLLSTGLAFHPSFMYLPAPCVEHDKWLFAALVFFPVKLLILRFCETSQMMMWFPSCSGAPRAEAGSKEGWGWGRGEGGMDVWVLLLLRNKPSHSLSPPSNWAGIIT